MRPSSGATLLALLFIVNTAIAQSAKDLFVELRDAGGVHPLAQLVCFPARGQDQDTTFILVAFSKHFASALRSKGKPVPKEFVDAEMAKEDDQFVLQWAYRDGVQLQKDPELLAAVVGSNGHMWTADYSASVKPTKHANKKLEVRIVFSEAGRYSRGVLVDDRIAKSVHGKCEPIDASAR